ncbi:MAG: exodeoxyribonuclease VII large subunit [Alphaproteobacteria bacterium]|nr:exodeoxyribonuclease VII large subunit [Alphaproteobacteria bacterium]
MNDTGLPWEDADPGNVPELSVSEISGAIKRTMEDAFGRVRVRGEIGRVSRPASGHVYLSLKDEKAVLDGVVWRGNAARLSIQPEQGMEVVATGKLTTFPGQSKYQIVIERMELAGEGALLKLLEERKKKLAAEGLFAEERKQPIPTLPEVIGVVTSPSGAVIRDILHRIGERFPRRVLLWPVPVQGETAAPQIAAAIAGMDSLVGGPGEDLPRPDVLIVARGGGSLEDLWPFNEEVVARAVAACRIPVISAVGHETDTTLIDYVADLRAPTPTGAAEKAVPVRADLIARTAENGNRLIQGMTRRLRDSRREIDGLARGLGDPALVLGPQQQRVDFLAGRLSTGTKTILTAGRQRLARTSAALRHPAERVRANGDRLAALGGRLERALDVSIRRQRETATGISRRLRPEMLDRRIRAGRDGLEATGRLLDSLSFERVLERGYVLVRDDAGRPVTRKEKVPEDGRMTLRFADGELQATAGVSDAAPPARKKKPAPAKPSPPKTTSGQGDLF